MNPISTRLRELELSLHFESEGCKDCSNPEEPFTKAMGEYLARQSEFAASIRADVDALAEEMREAPWKHGDACSTFCPEWANRLSVEGE